MAKPNDPDGPLHKWGEPEGVKDYKNKTPGQGKKMKFKDFLDEATIDAKTKAAMKKLKGDDAVMANHLAKEGDIKELKKFLKSLSEGTYSVAPGTSRKQIGKALDKDLKSQDAKIAQQKKDIQAALRAKLNKEEVEQVDEATPSQIAHQRMAKAVAARAQDKKNKKDAEARTKARGWVRNDRGGWSKANEEFEQLDEIEVGKSYKIKSTTVANQHHDVKVTGYNKKPGARDTVDYEHKGQKKRMPAKTFKARIHREEVEHLDEVHDRYMRVHGKKASGEGNWMFTTKRIGDPNWQDIFTHRGKFSDAQKAAKKHFGSKEKFYVMEKLDPSQGAGAYVKDFQDSDAPQFKGKSMKDKQKMAIAAYLKARRKKVDEEVEQVDEKSRSLDMVMRAKSDKGRAYIDAKRAKRDAEHAKQDPTMQKKGYARNMVDVQKANKKAVEKGVSDAERRAKTGWRHANSANKGKLPEEVEQVDEISKKTLGSYIKKASSQSVMHSGNLGSELMKGGKADVNRVKAANKAIQKRKAGIAKATDRLTREEAEQVDELKKSTLQSYLDKSAKRNKGRRGDVGSWNAHARLQGKFLTKNAPHDPKTGEVQLKKYKAESVEQVDELKKSTLASYTRKATSDAAMSAHNAGYMSGEKRKQQMDRANKRIRGVNTATKKLAKEEVEQIDEAKETTKLIKDLVQIVRRFDYWDDFNTQDDYDEVRDALNQIEKIAGKKIRNEVEKEARPYISSFFNTDGMANRKSLRSRGVKKSTGTATKNAIKAFKGDIASRLGLHKKAMKGKLPESFEQQDEARGYKIPKNFAAMMAKKRKKAGTSEFGAHPDKKLSPAQSKHMDTDKDGDIDASDLKNLRNKKKS